ncbi:MAG TPA: L-threonylcarbamoyladenylate synthase [Thermoanaerobaculia bacterium]|nr:L-threonylcarbamoyladenylate synthase [Thermoanaerobaculia bacterium]
MLVSDPPKVRGLRRLQSLGLPVPPFVAITSLDQLPDVLPPVPSGYSVRSAAAGEDGETSSMAGRFESFNGLAANEVLSAAQRVLDAAGAAIVQHTFPSWLSGVAFIESESSIVVESMFGSCRNIVDGAVTPYRSRFADGAWTHEFSSSDTDCAVFLCAAQCFERAESDPGARLTPRAQPFIEQPRLLLPPISQEWYVYGYRPPAPPEWYERVLAQLLATKLAGMDIEWGADAEGRVVFFQARPITTALPSGAAGFSPPAFFGGLKPAAPLQGIAASAGTYRGTIGEDIAMITQIADIEFDALKKCGAVLAETGGALSHVAILCRELGIPCITGLGVMLEPGTRVELDGSTGEVRVLDNAADLLREGKLVVVPTDTVYCLAADACNPSAVDALFEAKARPRTSPIIAMVSDFAEAERLVVMNETGARLARQHWPGALTLVLPRRGVCADALSGGRDTLAVRISPHPFVRQLLADFGGPIAMTSANRSGRAPATTAAHAAAELGDRVALIVDDGPSPIGIPSTVIDISDEAHPIVVREGPVRL